MYNIYIEFTKPTGFKLGSFIIRLIEGTKYSHVRLRFTTKNNTEVVYEAAGSQVRFMGVEARKDNEPVVVRSYLLKLNKEDYRSMVMKCIELAGIKYGFLQLIGMGLSRILHRRFNLFKDSLKSMVCSELLSYILKDTLKIPINIRPELDGPKELDRQLYICQNKDNLILFKE